MKELLIADDHPLFREALRGVLARAFPSTATHEAATLAQLHALIERHPDADLLLLDLDMPGASGFSALVHLQAHSPQLPIVIVSGHDDPLLMRRALDHGAMGYIPKSADAATLAEALLCVLEGDTWLPDAALPQHGADTEEKQAAARLRELTPQQFRILQMVSAGHLNKQVAHELGVSEATVKAHMTAILRKLRASNRTQAVQIANRLGLSTNPSLRHDDA